jgi:hypothetical protein
MAEQRQNCKSGVDFLLVDHGFSRAVNADRNNQALQAAEKMTRSVILSEAKNLSSI